MFFKQLSFFTHSYYTVTESTKKDQGTRIKFLSIINNSVSFVFIWFLSEPFYPFGLNNGDTQYDYNNYYNYGQYFQIQPETSFPFFGGKYYLINIYMQGFLTLGQTSDYYFPIQFPSYSRNDFIAPFWTTWNNVLHVVLSYRQVTSGSVLQEITSDINQYYPQLNFSATLAFIATWNWTEYYSATPLVTVIILSHIAEPIVYAAS
uniref:NIDO domain-containing protein n=1 Tax=Scleropages formosus TaxID=113540 RepID=A0A8C9S4D7_SCLFO